MRRKLINLILQVAHDELMDLDRDELVEELCIPIKHFIPWGYAIWDNLSIEEKLATIQYVVENKDIFEYENSSTCDELDQAAAFFLVYWWMNNEVNNCWLFEDLDFIAAKKH